MTDKLMDIWDIYKEIPDAKPIPWPDPEFGFQPGIPPDENWGFAKAIVDMIDRKIAEALKEPDND